MLAVAIEAPELYAALYESEEVFDAVYDKVSRKTYQEKDDC